MIRREDFEAELLEVFRGLIRIDTSNPPGNEVAAARYVKGILEREGIPARVFESTPGRGSVVARLKGDGSRAPLLLLSHLDVVPVEVERWSVDPFSAVLKDGYVWGRGTLDIKNMGAMEILALILAKRKGLKLKRDIILAATADEEAGGTYGIRWLIDNHFEEIKAEYAINEGGLGIVESGRKAIFCQCAEKGICWIKMTIKGEGGHGSLPSPGNPVILAGQVISRIAEHTFPVAKIPITEKLLTGAEKLGLLPEGTKAADIFGSGKGYRSNGSRIGKRINAWLRHTATPTLVSGGTKVNVIPMEVQVSVDCRILPGTEPEEMLEVVKGLVGLPDVEYEILQRKPGSESSMDTELWGVLEDCLKEVEPKAAFLPYLSTGGTDSGFLREKGVVCYGFDPTLVSWEDWDTVHGIDEKISVGNMVNGTMMLFKVVQKFCT
ncbi:MAG: M20/M25/M40 family metallo-hydrolase [Candidatus Eiseniibacteriota bacterium]|nr:MAG: M20/M25/M40 family metallo-hydrolase [Candidatus Eisenbacteria bacterium]